MNPITNDNRTNFTVEPGKQEVTYTREFNAPRELVFRAFTEPDLIAQWWGPRRYTTVIDKLEMRPGGMWRFVQRDQDGNEYGFHGVCHDVIAPERIVQTFEFEGVPGHVILETLTLEDFGGKTRVRGQSVYQSLEDRDGMVAAGMESGLTEGLDRLEELLARL